MLRIADLTIEYSAFRLNIETLEIDPGEILAVLGPNGSGKSTFLKALAGLLVGSDAKPSGHILWRGTHFDFFADKIAYVPPSFSATFSISVWDAVLLGRLARSGYRAKGVRAGFQYASRHEEERAMVALERVGIAHLRTRDLLELSSGERQLVLFARALMQGARLILLDEALSHLDLNYQARIGKLIQQMAAEDFAFVIVDHDLNLATEWATRALFLKNGKVAGKGTLQEMISSKMLQQIYPETKFALINHPATGRPKIFFDR